MQKPSQKGKTKPQFAPEVKASCRALYESGMFDTVEKLQKHCKKLMQHAPTLSTLQHWAAEDGWDKHKSDDDIAEEQRKGFVAIFAQLGMDEQTRAACVVDGIKAGEQMLNQCMETIKASAPAEIIERLEELTKQAWAGYNVKKNYLELAHKLCGDFAPEKKKVTSTVKDEGSPAAKRARNMTKDELMREMQRIKAVMHAATSNG